jgi:hypothetical protein
VNFQLINTCSAELAFPDHAFKVLGCASNAILRVLAFAGKQAYDFAFAGAQVRVPSIRSVIERLTDLEFVL